MRVLFVAYCFVDGRGQALIGVYKRALRVALELVDRGHEVAFDCTGRTAYRDAVTTLAEDRVDFVDLQLHPSDDVDMEIGRARALRGIAGVRPDLVVVGEAPMAGTLLEATLCAVELGIPVALLDNAYNPSAVKQFLRSHGAMMDGVVLTGPSCAHTRDGPAHLCQVPPFATSDLPAARALLDERIGRRPQQVVSVLAYDGKVQRLAFSLLERLPGGTEWVVMSRQPAECERVAATLPEAVRERVHVFGLLPDPLLFGLIELSDLAVAKYGFMQVTECVALRTPVICAYHEGPTWADFLPADCKPFIHVAVDDTADAVTEAAARRLLALHPDDMRSLHGGSFDAVERTADFLERLPRRPRGGAWTEAIEQFPERHVRRAVRRAVGDDALALDALRVMRLRLLADGELHSLLCRCTLAGDDERHVRLWARRYASRKAARHARREAARAGRPLLFASPLRRLLIEADLGQAELPPI